MDKIKIVRYKGRLDPIYEKIGEINMIKVEVGRFSEKEELCIDINDLTDFFNRRERD